MTKLDGRKACSEEKKSKIREAKRQTALRRLSQIVKCFECKIVEKRLNKKQREELQMLFIEGKWFYNHVLDLHHVQALGKMNACSIKSVKRFDKDRNVIEAKLSYISAAQKQSILARMISNEMTIKSLIKRGFQKHGSLQFKSELTSIPLRKYGQQYKFKSFNKVKIQGISGTVLVRTGGQLQIADELANANLVKKADGYYLKVTCYINKENFKEKKEKNNKEIGLDFGIKTSITTSEAEKLDVQVEERDRLKKLQKEMFRRAKGSNNRHKTIQLIRREYQKLSNRREDKANKIVSKLKAYSCIIMQDEQIAGWHKGLFGKQVQHSCLGKVKAKLKALPQTIVLDKWIPTTKWCPCCGKKNSIGLNDRTYVCSCGYQDDRDVHSAKNMLAIKSLVFSKLSVPPEQREVTLIEFKAATGCSAAAAGKSGQRSEKMLHLSVQHRVHLDEDETKAVLEGLLLTVEATKKNFGKVMKMLPDEVDKKIASRLLGTMLK